MLFSCLLHLFTDFHVVTSLGFTSLQPSPTPGMYCSSSYPQCTRLLWWGLQSHCLVWSSVHPIQACAGVYSLAIRSDPLFCSLLICSVLQLALLFSPHCSIVPVSPEATKRSLHLPWLEQGEPSGHDMGSAWSSVQTFVRGSLTEYWLVLLLPILGVPLSSAHTWNHFINLGEVTSFIFSRLVPLGNTGRKYDFSQFFSIFRKNTIINVLL